MFSFTVCSVLFSSVLILLLTWLSISSFCFYCFLLLLLFNLQQWWFFFLFSYFLWAKFQAWKAKSGIVWSCLLWQLIWMEGTFSVWMRHKAFLRLLRYRTLSYLTRFYIPLLLFRAIFLLIPLVSPLYFAVFRALLLGLFNGDVQQTQLVRIVFLRNFTSLDVITEWSSHLS